MSTKIELSCEVVWIGGVGEGVVVCRGCSRIRTRDLVGRILRGTVGCERIRGEGSHGGVGRIGREGGERGERRERDGTVGGGERGTVSGRKIGRPVGGVEGGRAVRSIEGGVTERGSGGGITKRGVERGKTGGEGGRTDRERWSQVRAEGGADRWGAEGGTERDSSGTVCVRWH